MAYIQYLVFNGRSLPKPDSYDVGLSDVEADSGGETEAGTTQRDVVRTGVADNSKLPKITVEYFDTETLDLKEAEMYITGFKAKLEKDTSYKGLWTVSFSLKEM